MALHDDILIGIQAGEIPERFFVNDLKKQPLDNQDRFKVGNGEYALNTINTSPANLKLDSNGLSPGTLVQRGSTARYVKYSDGLYGLMNGKGENNSDTLPVNKLESNNIELSDKYDDLTVSITNYINSKLGDESVISWLKTNYSWPRKTDKDSSWSRIKLYALFDKFYADDKKILSKKTTALLDSNQKYSNTQSLSWARHLIKINNYDKNTQRNIKEGDIRFNFEETTVIKNSFSRYLKSTSVCTDEYLQAVSFFIGDWGGVTTNSPKKIIDYVELYNNFDFQNVDHKRYFNIEGVASWSKYLSVIYPNSMLIYDARICFSLNALAFINELAVPVWPINKHGGPGSRNSKIKLLESYVTGKLNNNPVIGDDFYTCYLQLMDNVAKALGQGVKAEHIEMFLFSIADGSIFETTLEKIRTTDVAFYNTLIKESIPVIK